MTEKQIEKEHQVLKAELVREVKGLYATLVVLTTGQAAEVTEELENISAEKLVELKRKLKKKLDETLSVEPTAEVRFKNRAEITARAYGNTPLQKQK